VGASSEIAREVLERKEKYWAKALSTDAVWDVTSSAASVFDEVTFLADTTLSDSLFSSLVSDIVLGIPLSEIEPWNVDWRTQLPSPEEFARGVLLKVEPVALRDLAPELILAITMPEASYREMFVPAVAASISKSMLEKGYYDRSRYGYAYYDPQAVRDFLRSAVYFMVKAPTDIATARERVRAAARALDLAEEVAEDVFNRLSIVGTVKERAATFDYAWFDYSYFSGSTERTVVFTDYNLARQEVEYVDLFDAVAGGWFDVSFFDLCFFTEEPEVYEHPWRPDDFTIRLRDVIVSDFRSRLMSTGMLLANYMTPEERAAFRPSPRLEVFASATSQALQIDAVVDGVLSRAAPDLPPLVRNLYKSAAKQLLSLRYGDNRLGLAMYKSMTPEEFKNWWIGYWSGQGLDPAVLEEIWKAVAPLADSLGAARTRDKLRFIRSKLRMVG
jgi:hypothetical protein